MSDLRVTNLRGRTAGSSPTLPDGAVVTGIITATSSIVGSAVTINASGISATGVITATSFSGSGANLTGLAATANVTTNSLVVIGVSTVAAGSTSAPSITPTGDSNTGIFFPSADTIAFGEGGSETMRVNSSGELLIGTGTRTANGGVLQVSNGITFPATQSACSDPNTLDDYEEGTFTPTLQFGGAATGITYGVQLGRYTKVGRLVTATFAIRLTSKGSSTGNATVSLPFSTDEYALPHLNGYPGVAGFGSIGSLGFSAGSIGAAGYLTNTTTNAYLTNTSLSNTSDIIMTISYNA